jgi:rhomboid protease GluP
MSYGNTSTSGQGEPPQADPLHTPVASARVRLPLSRPFVTYILLALIVLVFIADVALERLTGQPVVFYLGAQLNSWVGAGENWRLLSAIFLHGSLTHLAFNGWALYSLGRDIEAFYSPLWFTAIYFVSGLAGNLAWYLLGSDVPSVGASGAIFGLIGAEVAYFVRNRQLFGAFGRQRLGNLAVLIGINLVFGFTIPNINNYAHLGGLAAGFLLGLALAPGYALTSSQEGFATTRRLVDGRSQGVRVLIVLLALIILFGLTLVGNQRWAG